MNRLITIIGLDTGKNIQLIYLFDKKGKIIREDRTVKYDSSTDSIYSKYPSAEFYEREIHDFYGVHFEGCPNINKRLFKAEDDNTLPFRRGKK